MNEKNRNEASFTTQRARKTSRLNMRVSDTEMEILNRLSYEDDESISQVVRKAIKAYINDRKDTER